MTYENNENNIGYNTDETSGNGIGNNIGEERESSSGYEENAASGHTDEEQKGSRYKFENSQYGASDPWTEPTYRQQDENVRSFYSPNFTNAYSVPAAGADEKKSLERKHSFGARAVAMFLALVLLCGGAGATGAYLVIKNSDTPVAGTQVVIGNGSGVSSSSSSASTDGVLAGTDIYALACTQVVGISSTGTTTNIFGQQSTSAVTGTGFVISEDGYILTNYHVVEYADTQNYDLKVTFKDGTSYQAKIVGTYSSNDVAVIKIEAEGLNPVSFGDSDAMQVGEAVYCVGNPLGELDFSMTTGNLSALGRVITTSTASSVNMFQFDAAVNSGNSGGPVYNNHGQVVGIVTAKSSETGVEGIGFAIPINDASKLASDLIEFGYITGQAYLGVTLRDMESYVSQYYNIPKGAYVDSVVKDSAADKAGIAAQDIIIGIDDYEVTSVEALKSVLKSYSAGDTAVLKVYRTNSGEMDITITFDENKG